MKTTGKLMVVAGLFSLAACDKGAQITGSTNQSAQEVAETMSKVRPEAGQWETTQEMVDIKIEGAPEGMPVDAMKQAMGRKTVMTHCLTKERAENPGADFLSGGKDNKCTYSNFAMDNGRIQGSVSCPGPQGGKMVANMQGSYAPTSYAMDMDMTMDGMQPGMKMAMKMKTTGKRIGECQPAKP